MDDNDIVRLVDSSPGSDSSLIQISDTIVKLGRTFSSSTSEALAMEIVHTQTTIPVPRVHRVIRHLHDEGDGFIVMDLVKNARQLHTCWSSLSFPEKLEVIFTMRDYLQQLRRIKDAHSAVPRAP